MAQWWANEPGERYYMEITRREDIGADLRAPVAARGGAGTRIRPRRRSPTG
jgi:hypothetical protein